VLQRRTVIPRIADKLKQFVNTFYKGMQWSGGEKVLKGLFE
jgi:hypothetical protein